MRRLGPLGASASAASVAFVAGSFALAGCGATTTAAGSPTSPSTSTATTATAPTGTPTASAGSGCKYLDSATIQQDIGITIATMTQIRNGCLFESASGSHDAPSAMKYLHRHDGVILGISTGSFHELPRCQQTHIPGVPAPGAVCQQPVAGGVTIAAFELSRGRAGSLVIYGLSTPSLTQVDRLAAAAYPKMLAG